MPYLTTTVMGHRWTPRMALVNFNNFFFFLVKHLYCLIYHPLKNTSVPWTFFFGWFLYRRSLAFISWSSTHVLSWITRAPSVQGAFPMSIYVVATTGTRTPTAAIQTTSAYASTTSATRTPLTFQYLACKKIVENYGLD